MSDKEARALGAGDVITVNGNDYQVNPIGIRELAELQREAVKYYKRQYLQTFADNLDLLRNGHGDQLLQEKIEEVARWDVDDLPKKFAYDTSGIDVLGELAELLKQKYEQLPESESARQHLLATALDSGEISADDVEKMTTTRPRKYAVSYDMWWVTAIYDGLVSIAWMSLSRSNNGITKQDISVWPTRKIIEAGRLVESITSPAMGNT